MKIVINKCYGGFSVSEAGMRRYAEIKGLTIYPEPSEFKLIGPTFWLTPPEERIADPSFEWHTMTQEERIAHNKAYSAQVLSERDFTRTDPALVQVVEELGEAASGQFAYLCVVEFEGNRYRIGEYDGQEWIETPDTIDWTVVE